MSLMPAEVTLCNVNFGPQVSWSGGGSVITARLTADRSVVHAATGARLRSGADELTAAAGVPLQFSVPHIDQPGFVDLQGNPVTGWTYTLAGTIRFGDQHRVKFTRTFQVLTGQASIDLDLLPTTEVTA